MVPISLVYGSGFGFKPQPRSSFTELVHPLQTFKPLTVLHRVLGRFCMTLGLPKAWLSQPTPGEGQSHPQTPPKQGLGFRV